MFWFELFKMQIKLGMNRVCEHKWTSEIVRNCLTAIINNYERNYDSLKLIAEKH